MPAETSLDAMTWTQLRDRLEAACGRAVALLPIGSTEPHGPHLALSADVVISVETARRAAARLADRGLQAIVLPALPYTVTEFSKDFPGCIGLSRATALALITEVCREALRQGFSAVCLVNSHLEPAHLETLREAARLVSGETGRPVLFPDKTRKRWAALLTEEFRSGACHAGRYETSLVMAARPALVDEQARRALPANPTSIGHKIKEGVRTFRDAGSDLAYFGDPAAATSREGEETFETLAAMVETAVLESLA
ncbi:MAG TPA: creatininase family protein [Candidatus Polarisedimenticolia bacterium]|nr:creatininase family protein [Candidatus Polarisedimenticolia bacterium]